MYNPKTSSESAASKLKSTTHTAHNTVHNTLDLDTRSEQKKNICIYMPRAYRFNVIQILCAFCLFSLISNHEQQLPVAVTVVAAMATMTSELLAVFLYSCSSWFGKKWIRGTVYGTRLLLPSAKWLLLHTIKRPP